MGLYSYCAEIFNAALIHFIKKKITQTARTSNTGIGRLKHILPREQKLNYPRVYTNYNIIRKQQVCHEPIA